MICSCRYIRQISWWDRKNAIIEAKKFPRYEIMLFQALFGLLLGGESSPFKRCRLERLKSLRAPSKEAHFPCSTAKWNHVFSELHANCWSGGSECSPPLLYKHLTVRKQGCWAHWIQTLRRSNTAWSIRARSRCQNWLEYMFICVFYRFWVPDEDLGASVSKLVRRDLEVGHQHLHSFPVGSQKGHTGHPKHTWDFKCP